MGQRRGILGGTFDPPHLGHVHLAVEARRLLALDEVVLVVANDPWQKSGVGPVTPAPQRLAMTELAFADVPGAVVSDLELRRGGPSYMVDTLAELRAQHPDDELVLLLGDDAAAGIESWERADDLCDLAELVVVRRPGTQVSLPGGWAFREIEIGAADLSSSEVRRRVVAGEALDGLVPEEVGSFITRHGIYREGPA